MSEIGNDATAYMRLAASLFELGTYGAPNQLSPSDWSPGAPLLYGGIYYLVGGVRPGVVLRRPRVPGLGTMIVTYLIARRLGGPIAGVIAAALAATYPSFVENAQRMLAEPVALFSCRPRCCRSCGPLTRAAACGAGCSPGSCSA